MVNGYIPKITYPNPENRKIQKVHHTNGMMMSKWLDELRPDGKIFKVRDVNWVENTHIVEVNLPND